jgi:Replication-relaxation
MRAKITPYNKNMDTTARARGRLFERPEQPRELHLRPRHLAMLANIARLRLVSAAQLAALDGGSEQNISRMLLELWENSYIERLLGQLDSRFLYKGSLPLCYGLSRKGASLLRKHGMPIGRRIVDGIDKERDAGWRFIEHRVAISDFMVKLELAARGRSDVGILPRSAIIDAPPQSKQDRRIRLSAKVRTDHGQRVLSVDPDEVFGLRFHSSEEESYFLFELDRGEMPVQRHSRKDQTYFAKKMLIYYEANRAGEHVSEFGIPNFRVATVTTTPDRVEQMIDAQKEINNGRGSNMFLFIDSISLAGRNPLDAFWLTGKNEQIRLTD